MKKEAIIHISLTLWLTEGEGLSAQTLNSLLEDVFSCCLSYTVVVDLLE
jgi:hypothetical protein